MHWRAVMNLEASQHPLRVAEALLHGRCRSKGTCVRSTAMHEMTWHRPANSRAMLLEFCPSHK